MRNSRKVYATDRIIDLVNRDYNILPVLSRFSIPLGVGNATVRDVALNAGFDAGAFLLIVNFLLSHDIDAELLGKVSPVAVVEFLHNSHDYFTGYKFPHIRQNLLAALDEHQSEVNPAIISFFDDYVERAKAHFDHEEKVVFPYVRRLVDSHDSSYSIAIFRRHHEEVSESLSDLKNVILRYYATSVPNRMYDVLVDIYNCEEDLASHGDIENEILTPMVEAIEAKRRGL